MAGRGPAPSGTRSRDRDQKRVDAGKVTVGSDEELRGFDLPELEDEPGTGNPRGWPRMTQRWWLTWRKSPQAQTFTDTDWDFLLETALIHRAFSLGDTKQAAELRLRVAKFGATPEDRMRLRLQVAPPASEAKAPEPKRVQPADRKERLLRAVQ